MPKKKLEIKEQALHYEERIVGMSRFWAASQDNTKIERLLRTPKRMNVMRGDAAIPIDGLQYEIKQIQYPRDAPLSMDLSLERLEATYEFAETE
jgi:hypothetical protein